MFEDPLDIFGEMDEMFARLFSRTEGDFGTGAPYESGFRILIRNGEELSELPASHIVQPGPADEPVTEVCHVGDEVKVIAGLPGVTEDLLRLGIQRGKLVIDAGDADTHYRTSVTIPPVEPGSMQHSLRNGVLEVTFRGLPGSSGT
jgi:HSP20 family molecular chaperone IbpA